MNMLFALSVVGTIALVALSGYLLSALHPASSSMDFENNDAYFAHIERRDRYFREEHLFAALVSGGLIGILNACWHGVSVVPLLSGIMGVAFAWPLWTYQVYPHQSMFMYGKKDMSNLGLSFVSGGLIGFVVSLILGVSLWPLVVSGVVAAVVWCLLFPM